MVVCKCRKATKLYCYVHKVPVCGDCICFPEHQLCVVRTYSEWVIDGDYEWPTKCTQCQQVLEDGGQPTCRLGCLDILHISCLEVHLKSFPSNTEAAGYLCLGCSTPIWPPRNFKDLGAGLPVKLAEVIIQNNLGATLLGAQSVAALRSAPPAFSSDPLIPALSTSGLPLAPSDGLRMGPTLAGMVGKHGNSETSSSINGISEIVESSSQNGLSMANHLNGNTVSSVVVDINGSIAVASGISQVASKVTVPNAPQLTKKSYAGPQQHNLARKNSRERSTSASLSGDEHDDALRRKYSRRGPFYRQLLRSFLPFWSPALPVLPVTAPSRKEAGSEELNDGQTRRRHHRSATIDPRRMLIFFAIMSCVATMVLLYYKLLQNSGISSFE